MEGEMMQSSSSSSSTTTTTQPTALVCDVCAIPLPFASLEEAEAHMTEHHPTHVPDYARLHRVVKQLHTKSVWENVKGQKKSLLRACGERVLEEGNSKDPGPRRMRDAHAARAQLEAVVQQWLPTAQVFIFGSSVTFGIWDGLGDIDFTVVEESQLRAGTWPPHERSAVRSITELLRRAGFSYVNLEPISHARVPIIKHHASSPLRLDPAVVLRDIQKAAANDEGATAKTQSEEKVSSEGSSPAEDAAMVAAAASAAQRLEAEDVVSRSVRYLLNAPASWEDRLLLEGSIRDAAGMKSVQQLWWNRTREMLCVTLDTTTNAIRAATCPLAVSSPTLRARVQPLHADCRPELYSIDFDLSFRVFGIRNSQLLRRYLMQHPCARPGAMILKEWSKRSGVNNSVNGFLTSYAVAIMWIYFLVQKEVVTFVDPVHDVPASLEGCPKNPVYVPMIDPSWTPEEREANATMAGTLLIEFFYFYAVEFDWQRHVVSLNRREITTKQSLGWVGGELGDASRRMAMNHVTESTSTGITTSTTSTVRRHVTQYNFCIEDPYEDNLNLGRHMGLSKTLKVQSELYRGLLSLLKDGERDACVFPPGGVGGGVAGETSPSIAHHVLYRLMAVIMKETAASRRKHHVEGGSEESWPGLPEDLLKEAMSAVASVELKVALKAWNWQQLIHRLGYKRHGSSIFPRREVGNGKPEMPPASSGIRPTTYAREVRGEGGSDDTPAQEESEAARQDNSSPTTSCSSWNEVTQQAFTEGFLHLTPEWVAWSEPWAGSVVEEARNRQQQEAGAAAPSAEMGRGGGPLHRTSVTAMRAVYAPWAHPSLPSTARSPPSWRHLAASFPTPSALSLRKMLHVAVR